MGMTSLYVIPLVCSLGSGPSTHFKVVPAPPLPGGYISEEDARYLDYLLDDFLFDPKHAVRVRTRTPPEINDGTVNPIRSSAERPNEGWFVAGRDGTPDRIYFTDGEWVLAKSVKFDIVDFERRCAKSFPRSETGFDPDDDTLAIAAWLYRRGHMTLATRALAAARKDDRDPRELLRNQLAKRAFSQCRAAFFSGEFQAALDHAERLSRLYPEFAAECHVLPLIVDDLKRRQREGKLETLVPKSLPREFAKWDVAAKIKYLIETLDQIEHTSWNEIHLAALIGIGDAAVPALIDVVERDTRLTRSSDLNIRSRFTHRRPDELVYVRDVALQLLGAILRVQYLDPYSDAIAIDCNPPAELAERFRYYWQQHGKVSFNDRMMSVLTDANARTYARLDAAEELIAASHRSRLCWNRERSAIHPPYTYLTQYTTPTVRQAIFDAMDQEAERDKDSKNAEQTSWNIARYVECLADLGDPNAGTELARRVAKADSVGTRLRFAKAAHTLGVSGPLIAFARDLGAAKIELTRTNRDEYVRGFDDGPFDRIIEILVRCKLSEVDEALHLLADRGHPLYPLAAASALKEDMQDRWTMPSKLQHPVRLVFLAEKLNDFGKTGVHYYLRGDEIEVSGEPRFRRRLYRDRSLPAGSLVEHAEERVADEMANRLTGMIIGLTPPHPLKSDVDEHLKAMRAFIDLHSRRFRTVTWHETEKWNVHSFNHWYVPDIRPLGRPATAADVKLGRAVFELKGRGTVAKQSPPTWLILKTDAKSKQPNYGLVVQAELDTDGKPIYGVIFHREIRAVRAEEVERIEPYLRH